MRTGVFGGTFDPVHTGHMILAETVRASEALDRIVFLPANQPPHKLNQQLTPSKHRLNMLQLSVENCSGFEISDFEIQHGGVSYTIDTLEALKASAAFQDDELFPIMGEDSLSELHTWKSPDQILQLYQVLCVRRPGETVEHVHPEILSKIKMIDMPLISISSSEIRNRVKAGQSIRFWVPEKVESYIHKQGLYQ